MFVIIDIYSKNHSSLSLFLNYFLNNKITTKLQVIVFKTTTSQPLQKKVFTVLKSPHVNKTAQEQFEYRMYKKRLKCFIPQFPLFLAHFKRLRFNMFSDINFKIKIISNNKAKKKKIKNQFNTNDYCLDLNDLSLKSYLKVLAVCGEFVLNSNVWVAQLVRAKD